MDALDTVNKEQEKRDKEYEEEKQRYKSVSYRSIFGWNCKKFNKRKI